MNVTQTKEYKEVIRELNQLDLSQDKLLSLAKRRFTPDSCPLSSSHHYLSQRLFGVGCFKWKCGFCGEVFGS